MSQILHNLLQLITQVTDALWQHRQSVLVLGVGLLVALLLVLGFVELTGEVLEGETGQFDRAILEGLAPIRKMWLTGVMAEFSALGSPALVVLFTLSALIFLWLIGNRASGVILLIATAGGLILAGILKAAIARPRPMIVEPLVQAPWYAYPSGHAVLSSAFYLTAALVAVWEVPTRGLRIFLVLWGLGVALLVAFTRVYLAVHYPTDVVGGLLVGGAWAVFCALADHLWRRRGTEV